MAKRNEIYKCTGCTNMVEVVIEGTCTPECCGKPMKLLKENTTDGAKEKHVPVVEKTADGYIVRVGEVDHPMTEAHYIQWIELITEDGVLLQSTSLWQNSRQMQKKFMHVNSVTCMVCGDLNR